MPSDTSERRPARPQYAAGGVGLPPQMETLPCDSTNTKFCYYNNYNLSQPRHFYKSCCCYWTQGGTLRNVPVGGGSPKAAASKCPCPLVPPPPSSSLSSNSKSSSMTHEPLRGDDPGLLLPQAKSEVGTVDWVKRSENVVGVGGGSGQMGFASLLGSQGGQGFLAMGGDGTGLGGLGFGFSRAVWPFIEVGFVDGGGGLWRLREATMRCRWGAGESGGLVDGDGFA